jgi:hypothetical protein
LFVIQQQEHLLQLVKIYDIDECNPVVTKYTVKKDSNGTGLNFGNFYAEHCKK